MLGNRALRSLSPRHPTSLPRRSVIAMALGTSSKRRKIWLDCDVGVDDAQARGPLPPPPPRESSTACLGSRAPKLLPSAAGPHAGAGSARGGAGGRQRGAWQCWSRASGPQHRKDSDALQPSRRALLSGGRRAAGGSRHGCLIRERETVTLGGCTLSRPVQWCPQWCLPSRGLCVAAYSLPLAHAPAAPLPSSTARTGWATGQRSPPPVQTWTCRRSLAMPRCTWQQQRRWALAKAG